MKKKNRSATVSGKCHCKSLCQSLGVSRKKTDQRFLLKIDWFLI